MPLIQPRQIIDLIGSSGARVFPTEDFGQPSHQGNSKAQSSSPGKHSPAADFIRHVKGAADCSMELSGTSGPRHCGQFGSFIKISLIRTMSDSN
jgi:hypothetical protein